jgi:formate hydrogenlyase subunit 3/multisubunit Na+/H+ antiporter MnhD subunit
MSGVMLKTAIYGLLRVTFDLLPRQLWWWGVDRAALGLVTALFGVVFAAVQSDMKRLLAYSSIENIGSSSPASASPSCSRLRQGAARRDHADGGAVSLPQPRVLQEPPVPRTGSVLHATHERSLGKLAASSTACRGSPGCARRPLAIAGLPPLNGFVSEWLLLQRSCSHRRCRSRSSTCSCPRAAALVLRGALRGYVMVKFYGIVFLGRPARGATLPTRATPASSSARACSISPPAAWSLALIPVNVIALLEPVNMLLLGASALRKWRQLVAAARADRRRTVRATARSSCSS